MVMEFGSRSSLGVILEFIIWSGLVGLELWLRVFGWIILNSYDDFRENYECDKWSFLFYVVLG